MLFLVRFFLVLFFSFTTFIPHAFAQQDNAGITLVPAMVEELANPGDTLTQILKITNESGEDKEYFIYKRNIKGVEAGGVPVFAESDTEVTGFELSEWLEIQTEPLKVPAEQTVELPVKINVPQSASPGSHFGGVFVSQEPPKLREIGAGVGYEVASIFSIRISGDITDTARIRSFSTDRLLYSKKNVKFNVKIENQGNILIRPRGPLSITSMFSTEPKIIMVNESQAGVFPGTMRELDFTWEEEGLGFGRYEAILALAYDGENGQKTIDASLVFWVFPGKLMLTAFGVLITIIGLGYALTRYYINRAILHAAGTRRISPQRYRKQVGVSRLTFIFIVLLSVLILFLLMLLIFFA